MTTWMRHGQSTWNAVGRLQGHTSHPPLTALGRRQAARTACLLAGPERFRRVLTSPAVRARQTADIVASRLGVPLVLHPLISEQGLDEADPEVLDRLERFATDEDLDHVLVVSHGDTIRLAARLLTGRACPLLDNGGVVHLPPRPGPRSFPGAHREEEPVR